MRRIDGVADVIGIGTIIIIDGLLTAELVVGKVAGTGSLTGEQARYIGGALIDAAANLSARLDGDTDGV